MRLTDTNKWLDTCTVVIIEITKDKRLNFVTYDEDYLCNQDGEIIIIGSVHNENETFPIIIDSR